MYLRTFVLINTSSESLPVYESSIEAGIDSSSSALRSFSGNFPSSKCAKFIMLPVCSWNDVAYRIYNSASHIASASEYRRDVYSNALENILSNKTSCKKLFSVYYVRRWGTLFDVVVF